MSDPLTSSFGLFFSKGRCSRLPSKLQPSSFTVFSDNGNVNSVQSSSSTFVKSKLSKLFREERSKQKLEPVTLKCFRLFGRQISSKILINFICQLKRIFYSLQFEYKKCHNFYRHTDQVLFTFQSLSLHH